MMAVLKGDGYGHGIQKIYPTLHAAGITDFAVAIWEEGVMLREAGCTDPILILGDTCDDCLEQVVIHKLTPTIFCEDTARKLNDLAAAHGCIQPIHLKIDTGMSRIGFPANEQALKPIAAISRMENLHIAGAFTHFADADGEADDYTLMQLNRFRELTASLPEGIIRHCANSAAIHRYPDAAMDMVRLGISMYGYPPVEANCAIKPVMEWHTAVTHIKTVQPGDKISYGCTFTADRPMKLATIACGYGDGYHRFASGKAEVLIHGQRCAVVGRICMDQMMADVTNLGNVKPGDTVILIGACGDQAITADDLGAWCGTISYEVLLAATERVHCKWVNDCNE
jgi:alanine racemase